jgi:hypothetical protein
MLQFMDAWQKERKSRADAKTEAKTEVTAEA